MSVTTEYSGIVHGLDELEYHRLPGLSSTGAKRILRSPAHYQWEMQHRVEKAAYDFGHAVHALVLGTGLDIVEIDAEDWRSKAARDERAAAYAEGKVPLLTKDAKRARAAAAAVERHPIAGPLFQRGNPEVSMFWTDEATGVQCRGRLDWLRLSGRPLIVDLKTTDNADPRAFGRTAASFGYDLQTEFYTQGYEAITGERLPFLHVLVETEQPHAVSVVQLDDEALRIGAIKVRAALERYRDCTASGIWPAYDPTTIHPVSLPRWAAYDAEDYQ